MVIRILVIKLIFSIIAMMPCSALELGSLGVPDRDDIEYPDDEEHSDREVLLGKTLFFDPRLSSKQNQSCATCHNPELGFSDGVAKGQGTNGDILDRNAPHIYNLAWSSALFWDGRAKTLEEQALGPIQSKVEMQMTPSALLRRLADIKFYRTEFSSLYDDGLTFENIGRAIAAFERTIIVDDTAFDRYIKGDKTAMSPSAVRGLALFVGKARCIKCHDGANFTDDSYHNIGVGDGKDIGRYKHDKQDHMKGAFKTPGLRNIIFSAPYMHDGSLGTLEEVMVHYNKADGKQGNLSPLIVPLGLTRQDIADLVSFMGALTQSLDIKRPKLPQ